MQYLLRYRSLTYAQRAARILERAGITATVTKLPKSISERGCGYGLIVMPKHLDRAASTLAAAGLRPERIYTRDGGDVREAAYDLS